LVYQGYTRTILKSQCARSLIILFYFWKFGNDTLPFITLPGCVDATMITDARVLQQEFIPKEVQHRDNEVNYRLSLKYIDYFSGIALFS